jgi:nicotinamidase-related amidase
MAPADGSALVVIDMQRDFIDSGAPLCVKGGAACVPLVQQAVAAARAAGVPVLWVVREHDASGACGVRRRRAARAHARMRGACAPCAACAEPRARPAAAGCDAELSRRHLFQAGGPGVTVAGSRGAELAEGLAAAPGEARVVKKRFSGFLNTALLPELHARRCTRLVLAGVQTPNCVRATAFDALALDFAAVCVLSDATASATPFVQQANLYDLRFAGCEVLSTQEWADSLAPPRADGASGSGAGGAGAAPAEGS